MSNIIAQMIEQISKDKNVDPQIVIAALEDAMVAAARKFYKTAEDIHARFDEETGIVEIFAVRRVVETVEDPNLEISLQEAKEIDETLEIDNTVEMPKPTDVLGRISAQTAKQVILQKVREAERQNIYNEYSEKIGEMVNGVIKRFEGPDIIVDIGKTEAILPMREQSRADAYKQGERVRAVITRVLPVARGPQVILSRTDPQILVRLFEMEIPEIYDGTIVIKSAVHEAGDRAKVAVASTDRDVDPVGACVGMKGSRINSVIRELRGEKIDIVQWSEDIAQYAANALNPAKISKVLIIDAAEKRMEVIVEEKQQSLAIGKKGQNVRLASRLIGWQIDVKSEEQKKQEVLGIMESLTSSSTSLSELEGISDRIIASLREAGIENVERILELDEAGLREIPGIGEKTAARIMEVAHDLFEEVEIEVPEGVELPTAIAAVEEETTAETDEPQAEEQEPEPPVDAEAPVVEETPAEADEPQAGEQELEPPAVEEETTAEAEGGERPAETETQPEEDAAE
ncbi:MAG: transcription termination factor NusA [Acidobacteriota bacterium]|jgi:N utilization substance protein A|nr:transcription termination factor NusA [Acidobacteriota bacterium]NLT33674.1 transcription termination factor NusA [Acidobacteriota bacterium]